MKTKNINLDAKEFNGSIIAYVYMVEIHTTDGHTLTQVHATKEGALSNTRWLTRGMDVREDVLQDDEESFFMFGHIHNEKYKYYTIAKNVLFS